MRYTTTWNPKLSPYKVNHEGLSPLFHNLILKMATNKKQVVAYLDEKSQKKLEIIGKFLKVPNRPSTIINAIIQSVYEALTLLGKNDSI